MKTVAFLSEKKVPFRLVPHSEVYDAQRLAQTLHVTGREVAKTVLLRSAASHVYVVAVLPATRHVDLAKAGRALGSGKFELAGEEEIAQRCPDCETGVLPPFGSQYGMRTLMDESLLRRDEIVFEANTHREAIRMKVADYRELEEPLTADFTSES